MAWVVAIRARLRDLSWLRRMDWFRGLRAATAISAPMLLGDLLHQPELAWAALGGFEAILSDKGGPYRSRIGSLGLLTLGGAAGCMLGTLVSGHFAYALPATLLWCFAWSYSMVLGDPFASASPLIQVIYICGLGAPSSDVKLAATHAGFLILGGLWAMLLSLFLWPVDPYRPARFAIANCYQELANFLGSIHELNLRKQTRPTLWHRLAQHHQSRLRRSIEAARHSVSNVRAESAVETLRGRNLIVLLESADMLLARSVALSEYMEQTANQDASPCVMRGHSALLLLQQAESWIATVMRTRPAEIVRDFESHHSRIKRIPGEMATCMASDDLPGQFLLHQITDATRCLEIALESTTAVRTGRELHPQQSDQQSLADSVLQPESLGLEPLRGNFTPDSLMLRHAARVAVVCGVNVCILQWIPLNHGYWMTLTALIVLQPNVGGTFRRSLQRIGGTVGGGILAAILAVFLHSQAATAAVLFPLAFCALAVLPVSYSVFCFFLTPTFVIAFLPYVGDWQLAGVRTLDTLLGALIAMAAMALLWPALERRRFATQLQRSLQANVSYLNILLETWETNKDASQAVIDLRQGNLGQRNLAQARRKIGLAHNDSEDSLDRLRLEPAWTYAGGARAGVHSTEAALAFVTYLRRFGQSITTLASLPGEEEWKRSDAVQQRIQQMSSALTTLESALAGDPLRADATQTHFKSSDEQSPEDETGNRGSNDTEHSGEQQLARMERQISVMRRSLTAMERGGLLGRLASSRSAPSEQPTTQPH